MRKNCSPDIRVAHTRPKGKGDRSIGGKAKPRNGWRAIDKSGSRLVLPYRLGRTFIMMLS